MFLIVRHVITHKITVKGVETSLDFIQKKRNVIPLSVPLIDVVYVRTYTYVNNVNPRLDWTITEQIVLIVEQ